MQYSLPSPPFYPLMQAPPPCSGFFCHLLKKSKGNKYLKILDFSQLFVVDAPIKKKNTTSQSTFLGWVKLPMH